jgi:hypothetical protein
MSKFKVLDYVINEEHGMEFVNRIETAAFDC